MAEKFNRTMVFDIQAEEKLIAVREATDRLGDHWLAIPNERQHLAPELHGSVSQALYAISLGAQTAQELLRRGLSEPEAEQLLAECLDYILALSQTAMAEMRAAAPPVRRRGQ